MREAGLIFSAAFLAYAAGAAPAATFGDSGEFAACAALLGLPHAPDYPVYTLAARAFGTLFALGNWGYRANLLSAACAALALAVLCRALARLGLPSWARWAAVAALGLSPLWRYTAGVTEVFAPLWLLGAALLWLMARFEGKITTPRAASAVGLVFGLGAGVHQTLALAAPAIVACASGEKPAARRALLAFLRLLAFAAAGFCAFAYLPLRAAKSPPLDWDHPVDAAGVSRAVLRKDYGSLSLTVAGRGGAEEGGAADRAARQLRRWAEASADNLGWPLLALAALGLSAWPGGKGARWALAVWVLAAGPAFLWLGDPPFDAQTSGALERFYGLSWLGVAALAAGGLAALWRRSRLVGAGAALLAVGWCARPSAWAAPSERGDLAAYDYGRSVQNSLPPGASLFMDGGDDTFYALAFLGYAQRRREDLDLHDRGGLVFPGAYGADFRRLTKDAKEARRAEVEAPLAESGRLFYSTLRSSLLPGRELSPWGLLRRPGRDPSARALWAVYPWRFDERLLRARYRDRALAALYPLQRALDHGEAVELGAARGYLLWTLDWGGDALWAPASAGYAAGVLAYRATQDGRLDDAVDLTRVWRAAMPDSAEPLVNLGVLEQRLSRFREAERDLGAAASLQPDLPRARFSLGAFYWDRGRMREAADELAAASRLAPGNAEYARLAGLARARARGPR